MTLLVWDETLSVGVPELDRDHQKLIEIINRVGEAEKLGDSVRWVFRELEGYANGHFRREEERMAAANYPGLEEHKKEHHSFTEWLSGIQSSYSRNPEAQFYLAKTVNDYLRNWLTSHIRESDMQYRPYMS